MKTTLSFKTQNQFRTKNLRHHESKRIVWDSTMIYEIGYMALTGKSVRAIQLRFPNISEHMIRYRLSQLGIKITDYRNSISDPISKAMMSGVKQIAVTQVKRLVKDYTS